ncbi:iron (metal) dependent repressor, DtxR family [Alicyclobacillus vulcanalis]|uniref:Manganese transport regulator n=2 Tax=Alicyclobacillus vulcanalis TaxID=252246 RepID=A0A1N7L020_9BACL|nr:iron (metal) dependent repressor, DtxR family [Alicyclobacillus vulcanalis]
MPSLFWVVYNRGNGMGRLNALLTPSMEDYLEKIYELIHEKGYARVSDIANSLAVQPSSVTKMLQKLDENEYVSYEKYRGIVLTARGHKMGRLMKERHAMLADFLRMLGVQEDTLQKDVEGIEHHVSPATLEALQSLVLFLQAHPDVLSSFLAYREQASERPSP